MKFDGDVAPLLPLATMEPRFVQAICALALGLFACDGKQSSHSGEAPRVQAPQVDQAPAGTIEGRVLFDGVPPPRSAINTAAEGGCASHPEEPALTETWVVDNGRMANAIVWLVNPPPQAADSAPDSTVEREPIVLAQRGCVYRPHVLGLRIGQTLRVTNEDRGRHNVRSIARSEQNPSVNVNQAEGAAALELVFAAHEVAVPIVCDLHPWMKAWVGVFDHPYFAVTGADGSFHFGDLPPGDYEVRAWHEVLGRQSAEVRVTAHSGSRIEFHFHKQP